VAVLAIVSILIGCLATPWAAHAQQPAAPRDPAEQRAVLVRAAQAQVGVTLIYDPAYVRIAYPGGDVPGERGVCSDVIVRAFRALGIDLQRAVHEDMARHFSAYPSLWGLRRPDRSIDHRRVPNLMRYFERQGKTLTPDAVHHPGDIVWRLTSNGLVHIGILSDRPSPAGHPLVIHNIGRGTRTEDILFGHPILARYRW
jgi:uncharacterized protein